jgi:hypothetical protein
MSATEMKHYTSSEWSFALDIPKRWNSFPAVPSNSPYEVIRFASPEDGSHLLIVFREPHDPKTTLKQRSDEVQRRLASKGFGNFASAETSLNRGPALMLDFDKRQWDASSALVLQGDQYVAVPDRTWSCRHYFLAQETLAYTLGFGTTNKAGMFELFERMARSFEFTAQ